jgi:hypothetical protein
MKTKPILMLRDSRSGFSLLEVLVACGVLVAGLAGIAAIMPAAGARLGEASAQDRAAAAVANAFVDISARGLVSKSLFQTGPTTYSGTSAAVFGAAMPVMPAGIPNLFPVSGNVAAASWLATRIDSNDSQNRGFFLEDELIYLTSDDVPLNSFGDGDGVREFNRGICWSALVAPMPWLTSPESMKVAKVSVAVFRKPPVETMDMQFQQVAGNVFNVISPATLDDSARKTFLKPCGFVLGVPMSSGTAAPQWLEINSSWMKGSTPQVSIRSDSYAASMVAGEIRAIGFEHLLTVTEQIVTVAR